MKLNRMSLGKAREVAGWVRENKEANPSTPVIYGNEAAITLDDHITELEGQLKIKHGLLEDCQKWMDHHNERADKAEAQSAVLVDALEELVEIIDDAVPCGGMDSFTTQPARIALDTIKASDKEDKE